MFDTGCVGANDSVYVNYSSSSSSICVNVEPNDECFGTFWEFTVVESYWDFSKVVIFINI